MLTKTQAAAIAALRMQLDPNHPGNRADAEIKAHLAAIQHWVNTWVTPLIDAMEPHADRGDREYAQSAAARAVTIPVAEKAL
jgi:hypothetical protein